MSYKVSIETLFDLKFYVIDAACWSLAVWSSCGGVIIIIVSENRHWLVFLLFFAIYESFWCIHCRVAFDVDIGAVIV